MTAILRIAAFLAVFTASVAAAVVFQNADRLVTAPSDDVHRDVPDDREFVQADDLDERLRNDRVRLRADGRLPGRVNIVDLATGRVSPAENLNRAAVPSGRESALRARRPARRHVPATSSPAAERPVGGEVT